MAKILILDDENVLRQNLQIFLEDEGLDAIGFADAENAEKYILENEVTLCIVDFKLHNTTGKKFISCIKKLKSEIKFIIHTGFVDFIPDSELVGLGITSECVLIKPVLDNNLILNKINKIMHV